MAPWNWSNGLVSESAAAVSGGFDNRGLRALAGGSKTFEQRLEEASRAEQRWMQQRASTTPERSVTPSRTSRRSWAAKESQASDHCWSCGGKGGCGYRRNQGALCTVCAQPWGHWMAKARVDSRDGAAVWAPQSPLPALANRYQPLEQHQPPWKRQGEGWSVGQQPNKSKGLGTGRGQGGKGSGPRAAVVEVEDIQMEEGALSPTGCMEVEASVDLAKLRVAYTAVVAAFGVEAEMAGSLLAQIREEEAKKSARVLPHVQLQRTQKKLEQLTWRADQALKELNDLEEQQSSLVGKILAVQARGRALEEQISEVEASKKASIEAMAEQQGVQMGKGEEGLAQDPAAARLLELLALAATHTDAGDETAKNLGMHLQAAMACLEAHLQSYDSKAAGAHQLGDGPTSTEAGSKEKDKAAGGREGSRSPRRSEDAAAASLAAAAKALAAAKPTGGSP